MFKSSMGHASYIKVPGSNHFCSSSWSHLFFQTHIFSGSEDEAKPSGSRNARPVARCFDERAVLGWSNMAGRNLILNPRIYEWCSNMKTITNVYSCRDFPASRVWIRKGNHLVTIFWNTLHHVLSVGIAQGTGELIEKTGDRHHLPPRPGSWRSFIFPGANHV